MARTFMQFPEMTIETPFGEMRAWSAGSNHIGLETLKDETITINRVEHKVFQHFKFNTEENTWEPEYRYGLKRGQFFTEAATDAAQKKFFTQIIEFLNNTDFTLFIQEGAKVQNNNAILLMEKSYNELLEKVKEEKEMLDAMYEREKNFL